jgi:CRISPR-associated protein Cas1
MTVLYVDRKDALLGMRDGALEVRVEGERLRSFPARLIERVALRADTQVSSATLAALADQGVGIVAFGGRGGTRVAHLLGAPANDARCRIAQCLRLADEVWTAAWSRRVVRAKLAAQKRLLGRALAARPDARKALTDAIGSIETATARITATTSRDTARGLEGAGAAAYFGGLRALFAPSLGFTSRRRRPAPDPVNACLSLGYTLLHSQAVRACWLAGLDPMVGYLHLPSHGRESMACDLVEPWRPWVDLWVWRQFRDRGLRAEHFGADGAGACLLGKAGRAHFYAEYAPLQQRLGAALARQARLAARAIAHGVDIPEDEPLFEELGT